MEKQAFCYRGRQALPVENDKFAFDVSCACKGAIRAIPNVIIVAIITASPRCRSAEYAPRLVTNTLRNDLPLNRDAMQKSRVLYQRTA